MATLALMAAGSWLGSTLFGSATLLGMSAASIGATIGAIAGSVVDNMLFGQKTKGSQADLSITASTEGASIPRLYGRQRISGQLIWATKFKETEEESGGKGGGTSTTTYSYSVSFAVALCEGVIGRVDRIWADGNDMDLSSVTYRVHRGTETQTPDALIEQIEGDGNAPAFRGVAYVVFEHLALEDFGNRIPQLQFEVVRPIGGSYAGTLEALAQSVIMIPGAGEFTYATTEIKKTDDGETVTLNKVNPTGDADIVYSLDQLEATLPNVGTVALVVAWFGTDLRAGVCEIVPGVESSALVTSGGTWSVAGYSRTTAHQISKDSDGNPYYGGTPSDASVVEALKEIASRGLKAIVYPFIMMDIAPANSLPNPYSANAGKAGQPAFPWRGRITCSPAPGYTGSVDKTAAAATQVNAFFAAYRTMVLHYANLCADLDGVEAILIGSELVGLTTVRSAASAYPAVAALKTLAADVRAVVGSSIKVGYGADWSEYHSHRSSDGSGDIYFPLDALWADSNIDFVAIDNYLPLADWRDGEDHLDFEPMRRITDLDYLRSNIEGGEYFDWYYANDTDRESQTRTAITDGAYGEPWVYRNKDIRSWWSTAHYARPGGVRSSSATAWVPKSKPIWFTELGCPAVDKGANQPNVFVDPKSSESETPHFSNGWRDDAMQRAALEATLGYWTDSDNNPASTVYSGRMVDTAHVCLWCWDARPFPFFPSSDTWSDGENWRLGHWLNGRAGLAPIGLLIRDLCSAQDFTAIDVSELGGLVTGYVIDAIQSARDSIEPLADVGFFDAIESNGVIVFRRRDRSTDIAIDESILAVDDATSRAYELTRKQETDLPLTVRLQYIDAAADYRTANAYGRRQVGSSLREKSASMPFVMEQADAIGVAEAMLIEAWVSRESASFALPPSLLAAEPGDVVAATFGDRIWTLRLGSIADSGKRAVEASRADRSVYRIVPGPDRPYGASSGASSALAKTAYGKPIVAIMNLPVLYSGDGEIGPMIATYGKPWKGVVVYRSPTESDWALDTSLTKAARMGVTTAAFASGPLNRWDRRNTLSVRLFGSATIASAEELNVFAGNNAIAIETEDGVWEVLQFKTATLTGTMQWDLTMLLRGQCGTDGAMRDAVPAGTRVVILDKTCVRSVRSLSDIGITYNWRCGPKGEALAGDAFEQVAVTVAGAGLDPYSPCHVRGLRDVASGDVTFSWVRRTRKDGDGWDQVEVPLNEASESYEIDILNGGEVVRTLTASSPTATWTAAQQTTDFGSAPTTVDVVVYQLSQTVNRGTGAAATIRF